MLSLPEIDDAIRAAEARHRAELDFLYTLRSRGVAADLCRQAAAFGHMTRAQILAADPQRFPSIGAVRQALIRAANRDPVKTGKRGRETTFPVEWLQNQQFRTG